MSHAVSNRFVRVLALHLLKNYGAQESHASLILGIYGPPGEGKTFQTDLTLDYLGVKPFYISGAELENPRAGLPAQIVRSAYLAAGTYMAESPGKAAAVVINDVETGIGDWGPSVQYTVNRQTVTGQLMTLADNPTLVDNHRVQRVPIIVTGNDLTTLHGPLRRLGRMQAFRWEPNLAEKAALIRGLFPELQPFHCDALAAEYPDRPVAFFAHVKSIIGDDDLWQQAVDYGPPLAIQLALVDQALPLVPQELSLERIMKVADAIDNLSALEDRGREAMFQ